MNKNIETEIKEHGLRSLHYGGDRDVSTTAPNP